MREATKIILAVVAASLIFYDVAAYLVGGPSATISDVTYGLSRFCALPFAFGALTGHLFLPLKAGARSAGQKFAGLAVLLVAATGLALLEPWIPEFQGRNLAMLATGLVAGRCLWPQTVDAPR
jgi:hypothetical protein